MARKINSGFSAEPALWAALDDLARADGEVEKVVGHIKTKQENGRYA